MRTIAVQVPDVCESCKWWIYKAAFDSDYCDIFEQCLETEKRGKLDMLIPCQECKDAEIGTNEC